MTRHRNPEPIALAKITAMLHDRTWSFPVAALLQQAPLPVEGLVFVLLTPGTAVSGFGSEPGVGLRREPLATVLELGRACSLFRLLGEVELVVKLLVDRRPGAFRLVYEREGGWGLAIGPASALPKCLAPSQTAHALGVARLDEDGRCAGDVVSMRGGVA
jgi:hypothetical protein